MSEKKAKNWFIGELKQNKSLQPCDIEIIKLDLLVQFFNGQSSIQMLAPSERFHQSNNLRSVCRKADSPSIRTRMDKVSAAQAANMTYKMSALT